MRLSVLAFPSRSGVGLTSVLGCLEVGVAPFLLSDRRENGDAFPDERVVRLPRRLARKVVAHATGSRSLGALALIGSLASIDVRRTLAQGRPLFYGEEVEHPRECPCSDCFAVLRNPFLPGF